MTKPRVFDANVRYNIYYGNSLVYTGNDRFVAMMYRVFAMFDNDYYVGVKHRWLKR